MDMDEKIPLIRPPVEALAAQEVRELVRHAEVVLGIDEGTGGFDVFFGDDALEQARREGTLRRLRVVGFTLDPATDQRELLGFLSLTFFVSGVLVISRSRRLQCGRGLPLPRRPAGESDRIDGFLALLRRGPIQRPDHRLTRRDWAGASRRSYKIPGRSRLRNSLAQAATVCGPACHDAYLFP